LIYYDQSAAIWALLRQDVIAVNNETISLYPRNYFVIRTQHVEVDRNPGSFVFFKRDHRMFFSAVGDPVDTELAMGIEIQACST
jgi:hypothetical protein